MLSDGCLSKIQNFIIKTYFLEIIELENTDYRIKLHELVAIHFNGLVQRLELDISGPSCVIHKGFFNSVQVVGSNRD